MSHLLATRDALPITILNDPPLAHYPFHANALQIYQFGEVQSMKILCSIL